MTAKPSIFITVAEISSKAFRRSASILSYCFDKRGKAAAPSCLYININRVCNLKCQMCDIGQQIKGSNFYKNLVTPSDDELDIQGWKGFIDDVAQFKPFICINGTEPLLYSNLEDILGYIHKNGLRCSLTTNGTLLSQQAEAIVKNKVVKLFISVDGPPALHDKIRGVDGTFDKILNGVSRLNDLKKSLNSALPEIVIVCVIMASNYQFLEELINSFDGLGIKMFQFELLDFKTEEMAQAHNRQFEYYPATATCVSVAGIRAIDTKELWQSIIDIKKKHKNVKFPYDLTFAQLKDYYHFPEKLIYSRCGVPWFSSQICADGSVIPLDRCLNIRLGNIKHRKFTQIWNDAPYRQLRKTLKKNKSFPVCARCTGVFSNLL